MTIFKAYNETKKKLSESGIKDEVFESKQIIKHITGFTNAQILNNYSNELTEFQQNNLTAILRQREMRYPLQYIMGEWDFYGRSFYVGPGVLVPRADTETIIDKSLEFLKNKKESTVLDLCSGSGCIGITLACEKQDSNVYMVEKYKEALRYSQKNIKRYSIENCEVFEGDIFESFLADRKYDLIVSNPPYVKKSEMNIVSPETKFEPETALFAEDDGLQFYKAIVNNYYNSLNDNGMIAFEIGINQYEDVINILNKAGFNDIGYSKDINGIKRVVFGYKTNNNINKGGQ